MGARPAIPVPMFDETRQTTCYMCACRCGIDVKMRGGEVAYIEGNRDHPVNRGVLCAKGSAGLMQHRSPARLRAPLRRVGPRGSGRVRGDHLGGGAEHGRGVARGGARDGPQAPGLLHRARPVAVLHLVVGAGLRHAQLRGPWRVLLGQHGGGGDLHAGRRLLGVRPARLGAHAAVPAVRLRRGPRLQPHQDGARAAEGARRAGGGDQPDPHRLQRRGRRVDRHHAGDRRPPRAGAGPLPAGLGAGGPRRAVAVDRRARAARRGPGLGRPSDAADRRGRRAARHGPPHGRAHGLVRQGRAPRPRRAAGAGRPRAPHGVPAPGGALPRAGARARGRSRALRGGGPPHPRPGRPARGRRLRRPALRGPALDRPARRAPRRLHRPPRRGPRHARHLGPCQRVPDLPCDPSAPGAAGRGRGAGILPLQAPLPQALRRPPEAPRRRAPRPAARRPRIWATRAAPTTCWWTTRARPCASTRPSPGRRP